MTTKTTSRLFKIDISSLPEIIKRPLKGALSLYECVSFFNDNVVIHNNPKFDSDRVAWAMSEVVRRGIFDVYMDTDIYGQIAVKEIIDVLNDGCSVINTKRAHRIGSELRHMEVIPGLIPIMLTGDTSVSHLSEYDISTVVLEDITGLLNKYIHRQSRSMSCPPGISIPDYGGKLVRRGASSYIWVPNSEIVPSRALFYERMRDELLEKNNLLEGYQKGTVVLGDHLQLFLEVT